METGLKIIIGAEDQATPVFVKTTQGAKETADAFAKIPPAATQAGVAVTGLTDKLKQISSATATTPLKILEAQFARLQKIASLPDLTFRQYERLNGLMAKTQGEINRFAKGFNSIVPGANSATQSLTDLSRIVQDAPYGFRGVANNLNPAVEGFQRLIKETGSLKGALKALGPSLMGAGGIGLAIGVVSSLLVVFGDKLFKSKSAIESQADALKKAKDELRDYEESLNDFDSINLKGSQDAQGELIKLAAAYKASQDSANISLADRKKIVDQLQEQYPSYFANIKDEVFLAGGAKDAYDRLVTSILATSKARAAAEKGVEIQKELLTVEQQLADATGRRNAAQIKATQEAQRNLDISKKAGGGATLALDPTLNRQAVQAAKALAEAEKEVNDLKVKRFELDRRAAKVSGIQSDLIAAQPIDLDTEKKNFLEAQKIQDAASAKRLSELQKAFEAEKKLYEQRQSEIKEFLTTSVPVQEEVSQFVKRQIIPDVKPSDKLTELRLPVKFAFDFSNLGKDLKKAIKDTKLTDTINGVFKEAFSTGFSGLGEGIAEALQGGGVGSVLGSIVDFLGSLIKQIGEALIQYGIVKTGLDKILAGGIAIPGVAAIAAGVAAVAIGSLIQSSKPKRFAEGGIVYGATSAIVGEYAGASSNPEVIAPLNKLKGMLGDRPGSNMHLTGQFDIDGYKLRLLLERVEQKQGRSF